MGFNPFIGTGNLSKINPEKTSSEIEVGFILSRSFWKKGFAAEIGNTLIEYGFNDLSLSKIVGETNSKNLASRKTLENIGLTFEKDEEKTGYRISRYTLGKKLWKQRLLH
jgi:[ribosomal protein S5]-alanine N-acetyltransferase